MNNDAMTLDLREADAMLKRDLEPFFAELESRMIPEALISDVYSADYAEDGSFLLTMFCADGSTMYVHATVGERLRVVVQRN